MTDANSARVNLAQGIVSAQARCGMDEALVRMHARAEAIGLQSGRGFRTEIAPMLRLVTPNGTFDAIPG